MGSPIQEHDHAETLRSEAEAARRGELTTVSSQDLATEIFPTPG